MGRKPLFDVESLEIGGKIRFPVRKIKYIYQYLNNFNRKKRAVKKEFSKVEIGGDTFIERIS